MTENVESIELTPKLMKQIAAHRPKVVAYLKKAGIMWAHKCTYGPTSPRYILRFPGVCFDECDDFDRAVDSEWAIIVMEKAREPAEEMAERDLLQGS
jgi:hypothetical protein